MALERLVNRLFGNMHWIGRKRWCDVDRLLIEAVLALATTMLNNPQDHNYRCVLDGFNRSLPAGVVLVFMTFYKLSWTACGWLQAVA